MDKGDAFRYPILSECDFDLQSNIKEGGRVRTKTTEVNG